MGLRVESLQPQSKSGTPREGQPVRVAGWRNIKSRLTELSSTAQSEENYRAAPEIFFFGSKMIRRDHQQAVRDSSEAHSIAKEARRTRNLSVAMSGIDRQTRVLELIALLRGKLDESTRLNVIVAQRQAAEAAQATDLARLSVEERVTLESLLAKARN